MSLFQKATNQSAYFKCGLLGFQGSGKTYTAIEIAIGLHKLCKSDKPIYFLDTETGSDWAIPRFEKEGIELRVAKTRAFTDLIAGINEAEKNGSILIIDSVTHFWNEMVESYKRSRKIGVKMPLYHWGVLKKEWGEFSTLYVNSSLHMIVCGRAGWDWAHEQGEDGKKELMKIGTKMKVEGEFAFEPSFLLEMQRIKGEEIGSKIIHCCHVLKDRNMGSNSMDGVSINNPEFNDFLPHIKCLNLGGQHLGVDSTRKSDQIFTNEGESYSSKRKKATILLEEIDGHLEHHYPGTAVKNKTAKAGLKKHIWGTYSSTKLESMNYDELTSGLSQLLTILNSDNKEIEVAKIVDILTNGEKQ